MNRNILVLFILISFSSSAQLILEKDPHSGLFFFRDGITKRRIAGDYTYVSTDNLTYYNVLNADEFLKQETLEEIQMAPADERPDPSGESLPNQSYTQPPFIKVKKGKRWGYLDGNAREVLPARFEQLPNPITADLFTKQEGSVMVLINRKGEELFRAEKIMFLLQDFNVIPYRQGDDWGFLDKNGKVLADAEVLAKRDIHLQKLYGKFKPKEGLVIFGSKGRYGVMALNGDIIHPARYTEQIQIEKNFIIATMDGFHFGAISHKQDTVAQFKYTRLSNWITLKGTKPSGKNELIFNDGTTLEVDDVVSSFGPRVIILQNGKKGCIDISTKKMIIEADYEDIAFRKSMVMLRKNGTYYLLNENDTIYKGPYDILPYYDHPMYKLIGPAGEGLYRADRRKIILAPEHVYVSVDKFKGAYYVIYRKSYSSPQFVLVKDNGEQLFPPFPGTLSMLEGTSRPLFYCIEKSGKDRSSSNRIALLDENLRDTGLLTEFDYFEPIDIHQEKCNNFILVKKQGKLGLLDMNLKPMLPCEYDELYYYTADSRYYRYRKGKDYGLKLFCE